MYERILIPLDGSPRSEEILTHLGPFLSSVDPELVLLGVVQPVDVAYHDYDRVVMEATRRAVAYLESLCVRLREKGLKARFIVRQEKPADAILAASRDEVADLIALASHGHRGLDRLYYGSTAERVLRSSDVGVLLVKSVPRRETVEAEEIAPVKLGDLLVPLDGSTEGEVALVDAVGLAKLDGATLHLVRVLPNYLPNAFFPPLEAFTDNAEVYQAYLDEVARRLERQGVTVKTALMRGTPAEAIRMYLTEHSVDLMVMTTHGRSGISRWMLGSVAESLLRRVHVPILLRRVTGEG